MKKVLLYRVIVLLVMLPGATTVLAQSKWGIDCRPSLTFPTRLFIGTKLEPGFGFDGAVTYNVFNNAFIYGGWSWSLFPQNKSDGDAMNVEKMGPGLGMKVVQPLNSFNLACYIKGGAVYQRLRVEKSTEKRYHSGREWGWQIESGLSLPLDRNIALEPGLKYTNLGGTVLQDGADKTFHLNDLSAGIILSIKFGK